MESPIDQRYRLMMLEHYLDSASEVLSCGGAKKWKFICPFCGPLGRTEGKRTHKKAVLLWNAQQHSWVFSCAKKGNIGCMNNKTFGNLIRALNPALGEAYKRDRWNSGTTGKGHNCPHPQSVLGLTDSHHPSHSQIPS